MVVALFVCYGIQKKKTSKMRSLISEYMRFELFKLGRDELMKDKKVSICTCFVVPNTKGIQKQRVRR